MFRSSSSSQLDDPQQQVNMDYGHGHGHGQSQQQWSQPHSRWNTSSTLSATSNSTPPYSFTSGSGTGYASHHPHQPSTSTSTSLFSQSELQAFDGFLESFSAPLSSTSRDSTQPQQHYHQQSTLLSYPSSYAAPGSPSTSFIRPDVTGPSSAPSNWSNTFQPFAAGTTDSSISNQISNKYQAYHPTAALSAAFARPSSPSSASSSSRQATLPVINSSTTINTSSTMTAPPHLHQQQQQLQHQNQNQNSHQQGRTTSHSPLSTAASFADETLEEKERRMQHQASGLKAWLSMYNGQKDLSTDHRQQQHSQHNHTPSLSGSLQMETRTSSSQSSAQQQQQQQVQPQQQSLQKSALASRPASIRRSDSHSPVRGAISASSHSHPLLHSTTIAAHSGPPSVGSTSNSDSLPTPSSKLASHVPFLASSSMYAPSDSDGSGAIRPHDTMAEEPKAKRHRPSLAPSSQTQYVAQRADSASDGTGAAASDAKGNEGAEDGKAKKSIKARPKPKAKAKASGTGSGTGSSANASASGSNKKKTQAGTAGRKQAAKQQEQEQEHVLSNPTVISPEAVIAKRGGGLPVQSPSSGALIPAAPAAPTASAVNETAAIAISTIANESATDVDGGAECVTSTGGGGGIGSGTGTGNKVALTDEQKRANHIASEQKRRYAIRAAYDALCTVVPALRAAVQEYEERLIRLHPTLAKAANSSVSDPSAADDMEASAALPLPTVAGVLTGGIEVGGEKIDGRAGPKSEAVVLAKTVEYMRDLLDEREAAMSRLQELYHQVQLRSPSFVVTQLDNPGAAWNKSWKASQSPAIK